MKKVKQIILRYLSMSFTGIADSVCSLILPVKTPVPIPVKTDRRREGGYMMLVLFLLTIGVTAIFASVTFYFAKVNDLNRYFAFGQQVARYARGVQYYTEDDAAITVTAAPDPVTDAEIAASGAIASGFGFSRLNTVNVTATPVAIRGPLNMPTGVHAPTAYIYFNLTPVAAGNPSPITSEQLDAIKSGAASEGALIGLPLNPKAFGNTVTTLSAAVPVANRRPCANNAGVPNTGNADAAFVTWGDGVYDCMNTTDINTVFGPGTAANMDYFDFIVPAWVAAQAKLDMRAVFRKTRPGVPSGQTMETDLLMNGGGRQDIADVGNFYNASLNIDNNYTIGGVLSVGVSADITGLMRVNGSFEAIDEALPSSVGGNLNVTGNMDVVQPRTTGVPPLAVAGTASGTSRISAITIGGPGTNFTTSDYQGNVNIRNTIGPGAVVGTQRLTVAGSPTALGSTYINVGQSGGGDLKVGAVNTSIATSTLRIRPAPVGATTATQQGNLGAERVKVESPAAAPAAVHVNINTNLNIRDGIIAGVPLPASMRVSPHSGYTGSISGNSGDGAANANVSVQCYGACPDTAPPPDPDPLD